MSKKKPEVGDIKGELQKRVVERMPSGVFAHDGKKFVYTNSYIEVMTGYKKKELEEKNFWEVVHPDFRELVKERAAQRLKGKAVPKSYDVKIVTKSGKAKWISLSLRTVLINEEKLIVGSAIDVTEEKKLRDKLRKSEEEYSSLFEHMFDAFAYHKVVKNKKGKVVDYIFLKANPSFEKATGLKLKDILHKKVTEVLPGIEKDENKLIEKYGKVAMTGEGIRFELYFKPLEKWYSINAYSPKKGYFATIFEDVTVKKTYEKSLKDSENKYRTLAENLKDVVYRADVKTLEPLYVNGAIMDLYGYSPKEWLKDPSLWEKSLHPDDKKRVLKEVGDALKGKEGGMTTEYRIICRSKKVKWVRASLALEKGKNDKVIGLSGVVRDITKERQKEEQLLRKAGELEKLNKLMIGRELRIKKLKDQVKKK